MLLLRAAREGVPAAELASSAIIVAIMTAAAVLSRAIVLETMCLPGGAKNSSQQPGQGARLPRHGRDSSFSVLKTVITPVKHLSLVEKTRFKSIT